jgi:hypothetical protein
MLCERFKDRGIRTAGSTGKKSADLSGMSDLFGRSVSANDPKYRTMKYDGKALMSSDDFAAYYKDLRGYKMPNFFSRDEREYKEAELLAKGVQESGKSPKKAQWLAITRHVGSKIKEIPSHLNREEFTQFAENWFELGRGDEVIKGEKKKMPLRLISTILVITLSLLMIVCSTVMVSRASGEISALEEKIESLDFEIKDLEGKLEQKNNMLDIKRIATEEYGMISAEYAASRYIDVTEEEKLVSVENDGSGDSWLSEILRAIGFGD